MSIDPDALSIVNHPEKSRFEARIGDQVAVLEYIDRPSMMVFTHTEVPIGLEGNGIASKLARTGLNFARAQGKSAMPLCPYVAGFVKRHPEYQDLMIPGFRG